MSIGPDTQAECAARRDVFSGATLIAGTLLFVLVMVLHPTAHDILAEEHVEHGVHLNRMVHTVALIGVPVLFLGLLGLWRRLGGGPLATAALVGWGFASVAVTSAAATSGFVASELMLEMAHARDAGGGAEAEAVHSLLDYASLAIHAFGTVHLVASSLALVLWAAEILRAGALHRSAGLVGLIAGAGVLLLFLGEHLRLDVHGFGVMVMLQAVWLVWVGVLLCRGRSGPARPTS